MGKCRINVGIAISTFLVGEAPLITHTGQDKAMLDVGHFLLVEGQPGDRPDSNRKEEETI